MMEQMRAPTNDVKGASGPSFISMYEDGAVGYRKWWSLGSIFSCTTGRVPIVSSKPVACIV